MSDLPYSTKLTVRPVLWRALRRLCGMPLDPPTEEEKADAIAALKQRPLADDDPVAVESLRILEEADALPLPMVR